jgi:pimeloyl-ACP methyl ester carboxylesterase
MRLYLLGRCGIFRVTVLSLTLAACGQSRSSDVASAAEDELISFQPLSLLDHLADPVVPSECAQPREGFASYVSPLDWATPSLGSIRTHFYHSNKKAKTALVLLLGGPGQSMTGDLAEGLKSYIVPRLPNDVDFIVVDHRGTGCSQFTTDNRPIPLQYLTMDQSARDIESYLRGLGKDKIVLSGVSYGSFLTLKLITEFPNLAESYVLDSTFGNSDGVSESGALAVRLLESKIPRTQFLELAEFYGVESNTFFNAILSHVFDDAELTKILDMQHRNEIREIALEYARHESEPSEEDRLYYGLACQEIYPASYNPNADFDYYFDLVQICPQLVDQYHLETHPFDFISGKTPDANVYILAGTEDYSTAFDSARKVHSAFSSSVFVGIEHQGHSILGASEFWPIFLTRLIANSHLSDEEILGIQDQITDPLKTISVHRNN